MPPRSPPENAQNVKRAVPDKQMFARDEGLEILSLDLGIDGRQQAHQPTSVSPSRA